MAPAVEGAYTNTCKRCIINTYLRTISVYMSATACAKQLAFLSRLKGHGGVEIRSPL